MREIRTSSSMRGGRKRAFARRACLLLYRVPESIRAFFLMVPACTDILRQIRPL